MVGVRWYPLVIQAKPRSDTRSAQSVSASSRPTSPDVSGVSLRDPPRALCRASGGFGEGRWGPLAPFVAQRSDSACEPMSLAQPLLSILQVLALDEERRFFWWKGVVLGEAAPQHPPSTAPGERLALAKLNAGAMRSIAPALPAPHPSPPQCRAAAARADEVHSLWRRGREWVICTRCTAVP